ncbi:MAG: LysM peptidoglycan-binding domain-containing protein [Clostridia bacterium]|nr:LysM peptidoglycan-binding domain-containing protein [Clostridia bacterium]
MKKKKVVKIDVFKFIRSVVILFVFMLVISLFIGKVVYSHDDISVKGVYVKENDTLWSIATKEQENNEFYKGKSVYYVMDDIKEINNLDSCDLYEGQVLSVNTY